MSLCRLRSLTAKCELKNGGACGVMVLVVGNGHGDTSSISGPD